jgi:hypothetical protein
MSPENVGYFIDGIRVPLLFHVGAGPSTLAPAPVDNVDLFPAAYPARYGHFAGAVIAGETTRPDEDQARGEFQVRVFDADAFVETPLDDGRGTALARRGGMATPVSSRRSSRRITASDTGITSFAFRTRWARPTRYPFSCSARTMISTTKRARHFGSSTTAPTCVTTTRCTRATFASRRCSTTTTR